MTSNNTSHTAQQFRSSGGTFTRYFYEEWNNSTCNRYVTYNNPNWTNSVIYNNIGGYSHKVTITSSNNDIIYETEYRYSNLFIGCGLTNTLVGYENKSLTQIYINKTSYYW